MDRCNCKRNCTAMGKTCIPSPTHWRKKANHQILLRWPIRRWFVASSWPDDSFAGHAFITVVSYSRELRDDSLSNAVKISKLYLRKAVPCIIKNNLSRHSLKCCAEKSSHDVFKVLRILSGSHSLRYCVRIEHGCII